MIIRVISISLLLDDRGGIIMVRDFKKQIASVSIKSIEKFANKKANSNCFGVMYEPKRPKSLVRTK